MTVREHHAPVGALRPLGGQRQPPLVVVREHHAPVGALRPTYKPSWVGSYVVREHHAPVGALRLIGSDIVEASSESGSTAHLQVH